MKCEAVWEHTAFVYRGQYMRKKNNDKFLPHYSVPKVTNATLFPGGIKFEILNIVL